MPISSIKIKDRLTKSSSVVTLINEIDRQHILELLMVVEKADNGIHFTKGRKYKFLGAEKPLKFSNTYFVAYVWWLRNNGYLLIKKNKKTYLTERGRTAILDLRVFLDPAETSLKFKWDFPDTTEGEASLEGAINDNNKSNIFTNEYIRTRILELSAALSSYNHQIKLIIHSPPIGKRFSAVFKILWWFYWKTLKKSSICPDFFGPLVIESDMTIEKNTEIYTKHWKEEYKNTFGAKRITGSDCSSLPEELETLLPPFLMYEEVKDWIDHRLEKDPDWFMPHPIWVELGFEPRREDLSVESVKVVSPPIFYEVISPRLPIGCGNFSSILRNVTKADEKTIKAFCLWIGFKSNWENPDFYKSWGILRKEFSQKIFEIPKLGHVARILDAALLEYITNKQSPTVNLQKVFDNYFQSKDIEKVINGIRNGKYKSD